MADKTTISSRSKIAQLNANIGKRDNLASPTRPPLQHPSTTLRTAASGATTIKKISSFTTVKPRPKLPPPATERRPLNSAATTIKRPSLIRSHITHPLASAHPSSQSLQPVPTNRIPNTNQIRKGLAKFSNPMECQRQIQALSSQIQELEKTVQVKDKTVTGLEDQLQRAINKGVCYATVVQYLATKLKLDSDNDLTQECEKLKARVDQLTVQESEFENKLDSVINDYKSHLQVELDLRNKLYSELDDTKRAHSELIVQLKETHKNELDDLNEENSEIKERLEARIVQLESELRTNIKDLCDLRKEHEILTNDFNKLEESLTKDKDARVKYLQEKINQLQKDVDSLNSVLEMRMEKIHALEKDSLLLIEAQNDIIHHEDTIKALNQQQESLSAALKKKKEQFDTLVAEHEQLRQDLKKERSERRRMTMKSEQLEYVLNESCASESNMVFNQSSVRDVDSDQLI